jgi:hypothetical protein
VEAAAQLLLAVQGVAIDQFQDDGLTAGFHQASVTVDYTSISVDPIGSWVYKYSFPCIHFCSPDR